MFGVLEFRWKFDASIKHTVTDDSATTRACTNGKLIESGKFIISHLIWLYQDIALAAWNVTGLPLDYLG